jgi:hypothetical protein
MGEASNTATKKQMPVSSLAWKQSWEQPRNASRQYGTLPTSTGGKI